MQANEEIRRVILIELFKRHLDGFSLIGGGNSCGRKKEESNKTSF